MSAARDICVPSYTLWFGVSVGRRTVQVKTPYAPAAV